MKKFTSNYCSTLLLAIFFLTISSLNAQIDLELALSQSDPNPDQWTNYSVTATITNKGPEVAQGINISIANPAGTVYQGGNEYSASAGTFSTYNNQGWLLSSLGPNQSATLTINLFNKVNTVNPVYSQVIAATPQDVDSTPNNGTAPIVAEDDEANSTDSPSTNLADLQLADIQIPNMGNAGSVVSYTLDLVNAGTSTANGDYVINVYLSPSSGQTSGTKVGEINTGNTAVGTINNVNGAISIPSSYPAGNHYLVFYADAEAVISESNENNNMASVPFEVLSNVNPGTDFCGFEKEYFDMPEFIYNPRPELRQIGQEVDDNYSFKIQSGNNQVGFNYVDLVVDAQGNQLELNENASSFPNLDHQLSNGESYETSSSGNNVTAQVKSANGTILFNKSYNNLSGTNRNAFNDPKIIQKPGGYYIYGSWVASESPNNTYVFLIEIDANGNLLGFIEEEHQGPAVNLKLQAIAVLPSGDLILTIESLTVREIYLNRMTIQGSTWSSLIIADLVSNKVPSIQYDANQNSVYSLLFANNEQYVRKVNAENGSTLWTTKLSDEFNPNSSSFRIFNLATNMIITEDGGVVTGYVFNGPTDPDYQTEIGKLDSDGNGVWWRQFDWEDVNLLEALFETSDGGVIFAGRTSDHYVIYKLNQNGAPTPVCNSTPTGDYIDLELSSSVDNSNPSIWSYFTTTLSISNTGSQIATNVIVNIPPPDGLVYRGGDEYTSSQGSFKPHGNNDWSVGTLNPGATAQIEINYFLKTNSEVSLYAQVVEANEEDADSTPDNGVLSVAHEDDETVITINQTGGPAFRTVAETAQQLRAFEIRKIYPNPAINGTLNFVLDSKNAGSVNIQIFNSQGSLIQVERYVSNKGTNQHQLRIDQLSSGIYYLMIQGEQSGVTSARFLVERE